ncbi:MAG: peptidylprolyl isomerase [Actinomycetota bacterium]|nr:peptidylprolyl isomerase [Actinomycetota bacterium]
MKRLLLLIAVFAVVLAACSGSSSTAATVNGTDVTVGDVEGLFYEIDAEFTDEQFAGYLNTVIQWTATEQRAETDLDYVPSEEEIDAQVDSILLESGYEGDLEAFMSEQNVSEEGLDRFATQSLIGDAVTESLTASGEMPTIEDAQQEIDENPLESTQVCASHILVATEEEAQTVTARLDDGEEFAVIAAEVSIDTGSGPAGGSLGCDTPARYVPEFAEATMTATIGVVTDPVGTEFGFHLILVEDRTLATADQVLVIMEQTAVSDWMVEAGANADVTVEEEYGTWQSDPPQVIPPAA